MALSILDGNQSATTLSTILSSGQHITAHTVVSLGTQAITDIVNATSTGLTNTQLRASAVTVGGTVTVGNSVTISSLPAISGTVTANVPQTTVTKGIGEDTASITGIPVIPKFITNYGNAGIITDLPIQFVGGTDDTFLKNVLFKTDIDEENAVIVGDANPLPISGAVTANGVWNDNNPPSVAGTGDSNPVYGIGIAYASGNDAVVVSDTQGLPISGTVTANTFAVQGTAVTTSNFTSTTPSTVLANFNAGREVLTIFNEGAGNLHICAGATCTTIAYQVRLSAGDYYEVPNHQTTITHSAVFATAGTARVTEVS